MGPPDRMLVSRAMIVAVWIVVAWSCYTYARFDIACAAFLLLIWMASSLGDVKFTRLIVTASFVAAGLILAYGTPLDIGSIVLAGLLLVGGMMPWFSAFASLQPDPLGPELGLLDGSLEEVSTREMASFSDDDSSIESGIIGPELEQQSASTLLSRARSSCAFNEVQTRKIEKAFRKSSTPIAAVKNLISSNVLTKFQAMHLLWGQESQLRFGSYVLIEVIGRGSSSTVYKARQTSSGDLVAVKIMHADEDALKRVNREMQSVRKLAHPNIVVAYDCGKVHSRFFIAMELVSGSDLSRLVRSDGPLDERTALLHILKVANGLQHAHERGVLHRDVKPGNMLLTAGGDVKLSDLGLSRPMQRPGETASFETGKHLFGGTLEFMAPEQVHEFRDVDGRADVFALGSSLFFLLTGESRLPGRNLAERVNNLTVHKKFQRTAEYVSNPIIASLIDRLAAFDPHDRIATATEAIAEIRETIARVGLSHEQGTIRVLVVEDDQDDMMLTLRMLGKINKSLETVEAIDLAGAEAAHQSLSLDTVAGFDIVLLDLNLPDSSGVDTMERFRQFAPHVPAIVMSGDDGDDVKRRCLDAGADCFLSKNKLDTDLLEREIFVTLARRRVAKEPERKMHVYENDDKSGRRC